VRRFLPALTVMIVALAAGIRFFGFISDYAVNVLVYDQWDFLNPLLDGKTSPANLSLCQHGPNHQGLGMIADSLLYPLARWNARAESVLIGGCIFAAPPKFRPGFRFPGCWWRTHRSDRFSYTNKFQTAADWFVFPYPHLLACPRFPAPMAARLFSLRQPLWMAEALGALALICVAINLATQFILVKDFGGRLGNIRLIAGILLACTALFAINATIGKVCLGVDAAETTRYVTLLIPGVTGHVRGGQAGAGELLSPDRRYSWPRALREFRHLSASGADQDAGKARLAERAHAEFVRAGMIGWECSWWSRTTSRMP